jgi:hypothetical protein
VKVKKVGIPILLWLKDAENDLQETKVNKLRKKMINTEWSALVNVINVLTREYKQAVSNLNLGCLHPVACTRSGSGFPSNATLFE